MDRTLKWNFSATKRNLILIQASTKFAKRKLPKNPSKISKI